MSPLAALLAAAPAVPYDTAGRYVAAGFIVIFAVVLVYVAIMAWKLQRLERELAELTDALEARERRRAARPDGGAPTATGREEPNSPAREPIGSTTPETP